MGWSSDLMAFHPRRLQLVWVWWQALWRVVERLQGGCAAVTGKCRVKLAVLVR